MVLTLLFFLAGYLTAKLINIMFPKNKAPAQPLQREQSTKVKDLKQQRQLIEKMMEQFNTPSTFAQYSKMQRQVQQLSYKIVELEKIERRGLEETQGEQYQDEDERTTEPDTNLLSKATVIKIVAYTVLAIVGTFFEVCHVPDQLAVFPISLLLDGRNYASGATVVLLSVILA